MKECPNSSANCRCWIHELGLAKYAPDVTAYLDALKKTDRATQARLAAVVPLPERVNTYSYGDKPQPWQPRAPRLRKAA